MRPQAAAAAAPWWLGAVVAALVAGGCGGGRPAAETAPAPGLPPAELELPVDLYFPGADGLLYPERRELATSREAKEQVATVVAALLGGPETEGLVAPFPSGVELGGLYLGGDGIAYVDLHAPDGAPPPPAGSTEEMQTVYSLVNSIALNVPEARRVVLLWNGTQPASFAGHLDTSRPLAPSTDLVAR
jgi:Sporulation and spore germination